MVFSTKKVNDKYNFWLDRLFKRAPPIAKVMNMLWGVTEVPLLAMMHKLDKWFKLDLAKFVGGSLLRGRWGTKVVPLRVNFAPETRFLPTQEILSIIERSNAWGKAYCYCRYSQRKHNDTPNCDHPLWTCLHISPGNSLYDIPYKSEKMKRISKEEVIELLMDAERRGLVHQIVFFPSPQFYYVICNCCPCCCLGLSNFMKKGAPQVVKSDFIADTDLNKCSHCGVCEEWCYFGARNYEDNKLKFNPNQCFGCGVCVSKCPEKAILLKRK